MSDESPRLKFEPFPEGIQMVADDWSEALEQVDAMFDLCLLGQFVDTPPANPSDGDAYLIGGAPTGVWSGYAYKIASCLDGTWRFYAPFNGLRAFVAPTGATIVYLGGTWTDWNSLISASENSIASAATCDLGAAGALFVQITGTTTIASFGTAANKLRFVRFAGALTLTHNAASLILLGGASRATAAGDVGIYASDASGNWRERSYFRAASNPDDVATKTGTETLTHKTLSAACETLTMVDYAGVMISNSNSAQWAAASFALRGPSTLGNQGQTTVSHLTTNAGATTAKFLIQNLSYSGTYIGSLLSYDYPTTTWQLAGTVFSPAADNACSLGASSYRWSVVYAATGTINTSGTEAKENIRAMSDAEIAVAKALTANVRIYRFCDAVAKKGEAARLHTGMAYEDVVAAFAAQGLDPFRYGIVCRDPAMKTNGGAEEPDCDDSGAQKWVLGLRYGELAQFVMAGLAARLAALEAK